MSVKREQPLILSPSDKLSFRPPFDAVSTSKISLKNPTDKMISYKIKTTAPKRYCVRPNFGFVRPSGEEEIVVMLQPGPTDEKHKFQVQSIIVPMEFADKPKEEQMKDWSNKEYLPSADTKLACEFVRMEDSTKPVEEKIESSPVKEEVKDEPVSQESVVREVPEENLHQHQQKLAAATPEKSPSKPASRTASTSSSSPRDAEEIKRLRAALEEANNKIRALSSTAPDSSEEDVQARQKQIIIWCFVAFMIGFFIGCIL
ncbi:Oidioi.mRNA.OKI2018_I69.chr2.g7409.t1.cds [Oikopleura dioica]|uniref:Oidioi.mRNA.OKI2018_I69.chr2.g7409.t1.cds n=1 Tax=Oikopleura dioica TaxID=34765 RepID=A0ABN7TF34_OIKDI|nr:Oidioi.mRNA.OKI2018_I69.chr2.g7409.t1.cds [Oikopleura dioica]